MESEHEKSERFNSKSIAETNNKNESNGETLQEFDINKSKKQF